MVACENSNYNVVECFPEVRKTSKMPNGGVKEILDYKLTFFENFENLDNWNSDIKVDRDSLIRIALLHDMGNMAKMQENQATNARFAKIREE